MKNICEWCNKEVSENMPSSTLQIVYLRPECDHGPGEWLHADKSEDDSLGPFSLARTVDGLVTGLTDSLAATGIRPHTDRFTLVTDGPGQTSLQLAVDRDNTIVIRWDPCPSGVRYHSSMPLLDWALTEFIAYRR